jgi:hypothetical protein
VWLYNLIPMHLGIILSRDSDLFIAIYFFKLWYRMSQEERSIFWEVIVSVILSKKMYICMCPIPNCFRDRAISLYSTLYTAERSNTPCPHTSGMRIGRRNRSTRKKKPAPVPLRSPQIAYDLTWTRTRAAAVGNRWLTARAITRSITLRATASCSPFSFTPHRDESRMSEMYFIYV